MTKPVAHILKDLKLDEISLCEFPASPGAHVSIFKSRTNPIGGEFVEKVAKGLSDYVPAEAVAAFREAVAKAGQTAMMFRDTLGQEEAQRRSYYVMQNVNQGIYALGDSIRSIYSDTTVTDKAAKVAQTTSDFLDWIKTAVSPEQIDASMTGTGDGDDDGDGNPVGVSKAMANKAKTDADPAGTGAVTVPGKISKADAGKAHPDGGVIGEDGNVAKSIVLGEGEVIMKQADIAQYITEAVQKALTDPNGEPAKLRETVAKMAAEREHTVIVQKATRLVDGVPHVTVDQAVSIMKALAGNTEALTAYEATLNGARVLKHLAPIGADGGTGTVVKAVDRLENAIDGVIAEQVKVGKAMSRAAAQEVVMQAQPGLYAEIKAERRAG